MKRIFGLALWTSALLLWVCLPALASCRPLASSSLPEAEAHQLSVVTQNAWLFHDAHKDFRYDKAQPKAQVAARVKALAGYVIKRLGAPDLLALQEVENRALLNRLTAAIKTAGGPSYRVYFNAHQDVAGNAVAVLARPPVRVGEVRSLFAGEHLAHYRHAAVFSRLPLLVTLTAPLKMQLVVVHLRSAKGLHKAHRRRYVVAKRRAQSRALIHWAAHQSGHWMVLGDFNSGLGKPAFAAPWRRLKAAGWREAQAASGNYSYRYHCKRQQLDHIYLSGELWPRLDGVGFAHGNAGRYRQLYSSHGTRVVSDHDGMGVMLRY